MDKKDSQSINWYMYKKHRKHRIANLHPAVNDFSFCTSYMLINIF